MHIYSRYSNITKHQLIQAFICQYHICAWILGLKIGWMGAHLREKEEVAIAIVMMVPICTMKI